jgi:Xaa-Pro aminopeptidase
VDCWLTFVRETTGAPDPVLPLILGQHLTWQSALILGRDGSRIAIVGKYDDEAVRAGGAWTEVIPYVEGIRAPLVATLKRLDPRSIAVNFSLDDVRADGLSHGMFLLLQEHLAGTPYGTRLSIAADVIAALRGRKTAGEIERVRRAVSVAEDVLAAAGSFARPGCTEAQLARFMRGEAAKRGAAPAWDEAQCPIVTTGPCSMVGHAPPSETLAVAPGKILHIDFGVRVGDYCSDLQRAWYVTEPGESRVPASVERAFRAIREAISRAAEVLRPGVEGWRVDDAARRSLVAAGYPEYRHATGHQVGRAAHDGGAVLGPRWERYGRTPFYPVEPSSVFALELGVDDVDGRGYLGLEEMVLVREGGCEFISHPQGALPAMPGAPGR